MPGYLRSSIRISSWGKDMKVKGDPLGCGNKKKKKEGSKYNQSTAYAYIEMP